MARSAPLTPEQRSMRARIAAHAMHRRNDAKKVTKAATAAGPQRLTYWRNKVDPERLLDDAERTRRAEHARSEHFARLAYRSARARAQRRAG